jgi:Ca2+-transporting ATPase
MRKMAAMNNLVRRMHACETIGAATVICSDKTGTLTRNEMRVVAAEFAWLNGEPPTRRTAALLMESMAANSTANLSRETGADPVPIGNPTEGALLLWMHEHGVDYATERSNFTIDVQWTFTTERKFMGTLGQSAVLGRTVVFVKGAPEIVLERCSQRHAAGSAMALSDADRQEIRDHVASYQVRAKRVLALAYSVDPASHDLETVGRDMIWFGFVAISDPVREEVPGAVAQCQAAGVRVKIVTGDNPVTTREIARQIGLTKDSAARHFALTGPEFGAMDDAAASEAAEELTILARARPIDKMRLVQLLQKRGHVVAVTGDGVNDGPALNYADVGLSMGKTGSAVAKEASDIVLLDDSFRSIVTAVMWGRSLYENIQRFLLFQLTINVAALGLALLGPLVGVKLPLTVMQMLWINLIMDTFAALALATQPANPRVLERKPRHVSDFIVTKTMAFGIFGMGTLVLVIMLGLMAWLSREGIAIDSEAPSRGGTIVFTVFVLLQFWNLFNARAMGSDRPGFIGLTANPWFLLIVAAIALGQMLIVQFGGTFFRTVPLTAVDWLLAFAATSGILVIGEGVRFLRHMIGKQATRS